MSTVIEDKLKEAYYNKNNNIKNFIWKGPKQVNDKGVKVQTEIRLIDATAEQLNSFYQHCKSMLYNTDKNNPGRYTLLNIIKTQREKCNAELYLRYLESDTNHPKYPRYTYLTDLRSALDLNRDTVPKSEWKTTPITVMTSGIPEEFQNLSIEMVMDACLDKLGVFERKHITTKFITKLGLWFTPQELASLTEKDENGEIRNRLQVVKERLNLKNIEAEFIPERPNTAYLRLNPKGLSLSEFTCMIHLKSKKYSDLSTEQLTVLRNKILFRFEDEVNFHISQWETRMRQIEKVAESKGITLD